MSNQLVSGQFPTLDFFGLGARSALIDARTGANFGQYTAGAVRVSYPTIQPTLVQQWNIIGFSVKIRIGGYTQVALGSMFARLGTLWAGLVIDGNIANVGGVNSAGGLAPGIADLPFDLSTLTQVWDGQEDALKCFNNATPPDTGDYQLIGRTFGLPTQVPARPGTQFQMVLVLTPSMMGPGFVAIDIRTCTYTIIYDDGN